MTSCIWVDHGILVFTVTPKSLAEEHVSIRESLRWIWGCTFTTRQLSPLDVMNKTLDLVEPNTLYTTFTQHVIHNIYPTRYLQHLPNTLYTTFTQHVIHNIYPTRYLQHLPNTLFTTFTQHVIYNIYPTRYLQHLPNTLYTTFTQHVL